MSTNLKRKLNVNKKSRKRSAFRHSKNSKGMKLLWHPSTMILTGKYAGMTLGSVLRRDGKMALPELLKYYRISSTIMDKYHCTLKPHDVKSKATVSIRKETVTQENNPVFAESSATMTMRVSRFVESTDALDTNNRVELDDNRWTSSRSDYESGVLYDPEDDVPDWHIFKGEGDNLSYWDDTL